MHVLEHPLKHEASWEDVQAKAKDIRANGGVNVISVNPPYYVANVEGDNGVYESSVMQAPDSAAIGMWTCNCKWATYAWGRTGKWKKYEGRSCAHVLALNYELQARGMFGKEIQEDTTSPDWVHASRLKAIALRRVAMSQYRGEPDDLDALVDWYVQTAHEEESRTSRDLRELAEHNGGEMAGFDYRFKSADSLRRKLKDRMGRGGDPTALVQDALRYTIDFHPADYSAQVRDVLYGLDEKGYGVDNGENTWQRGDSYSGLHYAIVTPGGLTIELQFHTNESFNLKNLRLHKLYEEFRDSGTSLQRKQELFDLMTKYWDDIAIPDDVLGWGKLIRYRRPAHLIAQMEVHQSYLW